MSRNEYHPRACRGCQGRVWSRLKIRHWVSESQRRFIIRALLERARREQEKGMEGARG